MGAIIPTVQRAPGNFEYIYIIMKTNNLCGIISIQIKTHSSENKDTFPSLTIATRKSSVEYFSCKLENGAVPYLMSHPSPFTDP